MCLLKPTLHPCVTKTIGFKNNWMCFQAVQMKLTPHLNVILVSTWTLSSRCGEWASVAESAFLEKSAPLLLVYQLAHEDDLNSFQKCWEKKETWTHFCCCNCHPQTGRAAYLETRPLNTSALSSRHSGYARESYFLSTLNEVSHHSWIEDTFKKVFMSVEGT